MKFRVYRPDGTTFDVEANQGVGFAVGGVAVFWQRDNHAQPLDYQKLILSPDGYDRIECIDSGGR